MQQKALKNINRDMIYDYNSVKIFYQVFNKNKSRPIFLLHGWGCDGGIFKSLIENFPDKTFITIDFPPFGRSDKHISDWNIFTYVGMFMSLCDHLNIEKCDIVGHSFGGRVAIITSAVKRSLVQSCILVDTAGLKPKRKIGFYLSKIKYNFYKKIGKDISGFGSKDYLALSPEMKTVFKNIVNVYLEDYARKMKVKTLIVWGKEDSETPLYMGKRLNKLIKRSSLKVITNAGHFAFLDCPFHFYKLVNEFWEDPWQF